MRYWPVAAAGVVDTVSASLLGMRPELGHSTAHAGSNTGTASPAMGGVVFGGEVFGVCLGSGWSFHGAWDFLLVGRLLVPMT